MTDRVKFKSDLTVHVSNAVYGSLDYLAYPLGMLIVAPVALRAFGAAQYGVWALATAAVSAGSIVASGFGDANIRSVAVHRGRDNSGGILRAVRSAMGIHVALGLLMALTTILVAPGVAARVTASAPSLATACAWSLRLAGICMLVRAVETVCISTQRAFERYGAAVRVSICARILSLLTAAVLALKGFGVSVVMLAGVILTATGLVLQIASLKKLVDGGSLAPSFDPQATRDILAFGIFTWIQAVSGLVFTQVDRLVTGVFLGATTVASYALCAQLCQPIYGMTASALHFLFPHLASRHVSQTASQLRRTVLVCVVANGALVATGALGLLVFGQDLLRAWVGEGIASSSSALLSLLAIGTATTGLGVTGTYALLALGRVRVVTLIGLFAGALMLLLMLVLLPRHGASGAAWARLISAPLTLLVYVPLFVLLRRPFSVPSFTSSPAAQLEEI